MGEGLCLAADPSSASLARRYVSGVLSDAGIEADLIDDAVLLTSELVTNALLHTGTETMTQVEVADQRVRIEVADGSPVVPKTRTHVVQATTGRGLQLLGQLASRWDVEVSDRLEGYAKVVWFEIDCPDEPRGEPGSEEPQSVGTFDWLNEVDAL